ncbi:MAG: hypothetical protein K2Y27_13365 [Xanthobacteraceae bacterium]|nr:hypothetical protein [Xanthobacteraceae bacterium]
MSKAPFAFAVLLALALLPGCAGSGGELASSSGSQVAGDENGGKIPNALGSSSGQSAAYQQVTTHCEKFGKKGIITKMDYDTGLVTFECRLLKGRSTG